MIGTRTQVEVTDLPAELQGMSDDDRSQPALELPESGVDLPGLVARIERDMIDRALARTDQNKGAAARLLGLKRTTLVEKLKRL
jgi:sigma-54 specific flagellar transcriptional regulator A